MDSRRKRYTYRRTKRGDAILMKKKTKKLILELLDFWPMTIVVPAMLILILFGNIFGWGG
jgi:hypothetical protein